MLPRIRLKNINQLETRTKEIQEGYAEIQREQLEIRRQVDEAKADHSKIAEELAASEKDEKELETFIQTRQKELEEWKGEEQEVSKNWRAPSGSKYCGTEGKLCSGEPESSYRGDGDPSRRKRADP